MYRPDRPLAVTAFAIVYIIPGLWLILSGLYVVPAGLCLMLFASGMVSTGLWLLILGVWQFVVGLVLWTGHRLIRRLVVVGPALTIALNTLSGLTGHGWSPWTVLLSFCLLWYLQTAEAKRFFNLA